MLKLDLKRVFDSRGIRNAMTMMVKWGISRPTAWNLLDNKVSSINSKHLEILCERLNCEPSDLYAWKPASDTVNVETHPLKRLLRDENTKSITETLKEIPLDKLNEARELLAGLKNND